MSTLYVMTVDTEEEWDWALGWPTTRPSVANIQRLPRFQDLLTRLGVSTTYFVDKAVLDAPEARRIILDLAGRDGVEIGMHIHPWNTPPIVGDGPVAARETYLHNLPDDLVLSKLGSVYESFLEAGLRPTSFRGGRYSSGGGITRFLRDRGFVADSSVVPYMFWSDDGAPDYRTHGPEPIRLPARHDGDQPFWEIPLTRGFTRRPDRLWRRAYELVEQTWLRHLHPIGIADRLGVVRQIWLNFELTSGPRMISLLRRLRRERPPCICFTVHSSSLMAGGSPYTRTGSDEARILAHVESVFGTVAGWDEFRPATMTEVAERLEEAHNESARN